MRPQDWRPYIGGIVQKVGVSSTRRLPPQAADEIKEKVRYLSGEKGLHDHLVLARLAADGQKIGKNTLVRLRYELGLRTPRIKGRAAQDAIVYPSGTSAELVPQPSLDSDSDSTDIPLDQPSTRPTLPPASIPSLTTHPDMAQKHYDKRFRPAHSHPQSHQQHQHQHPPQPALSPADMHSGLVALLDRFVAAETTSTADKDTLHHARELRNRLAARPHAPSAAARRDLDAKRPDKSTPVAIPPYVHRTLADARELPPLPPIAEPALHDAVFTHRSFYAKSGEKTVYTDLDLDYERLEFLGDAYIELIASHALYNRFPHVDVPQLCSWRERLVENTALGKFSTAYGFPDRLRHHNKWDPASKAWKKVVADIFEAYVAGIVLSDPTHGYTTAEAWLTALWAPQLLSFKEKPVANPAAKNDLARLLTVHDTRVEYRDERPMTYDADHLQHYYLGAYLTGWGYENEWLGSGEGQKRADAALAAAADAIQRNSDVLRDASRKKSEMLARVKREKEEKARVEGEGGTKMENGVKGENGAKRGREGEGGGGGDESEKKRKKRD